MIKNTDRVFLTMCSMGIDVVHELICRRMDVEADNIRLTRDLIKQEGFEVVKVETDQLLMADGREIFWTGDTAWALRPEVHAERLAEAMTQAKKRDAILAEQKTISDNSSQAICHALIDSQLCGGSLLGSSVCPNSSLGKAGVVSILTCEICGHKTTVMRGEK